MIAKFFSGKAWIHPQSKKHWALVIVLGLLVALLLLAGIGRAFGWDQRLVYQAHPLFGYRPGPDQHLTHHGKHLSINNIGLRSATDWGVDPSNYVLFLGGSTTWGTEHIDNSALFSSIAVRDFPDWTAGNAAVSGWGVMNVAALVQDLGFNPAHIYVSVFSESDFTRGMVGLGDNCGLWARAPHGTLDALFYTGIDALACRKNQQPQYPLSAHDRYVVTNQAVGRLKAYDRHLQELGHYHRIYISPTRAQALGQAHKNRELTLLFQEYELEVTYLQDYLEMPNEKIVPLYRDATYLSTEGHRVWGQILRHDLAVLRAEIGLGQTRGETL